MWILAQGIWNDDGVWDDNAKWIDSYDGIELLAINSGVTESVSKNSEMHDSLNLTSVVEEVPSKNSDIEDEAEKTGTIIIKKELNSNI